eukprot:TRINITY_DN1099_c0_g1_i1.p1 TRINITY_DN1099_c0_g1~~TRINITY_DN1099_c0_g1_i1.p1  ORF type:complete len:306 (-),score=45.85 TRINITY_DN1099_c0_g1_i1:316-1134(-)
MAATAATCSGLVVQQASSLSSASRGFLAGSSSVSLKVAPVSVARTGVVNCRAEKSEEEQQQVTRRLALALVAGAAVIGTRAQPANAARGETANIFGKVKVQSGFTTISGAGFKINVPSKWNPSKEVEYPGQVLRFEDNSDATMNVSVSVIPSDKKAITDYGSPEEFVSELSYLFGKSSYSGKTISEGGFDPNAVSTGNILESSQYDVDGKTYYNVNVLTRTADGTEGGRHQIVVGAVSDGKLYVTKAQAGEKRWFKGAKKFVEGSASSFSLA